MKRKIGFYGGTFDPIHFGHVNLVLEMIEKGKVDSVLLCPAQINPFKQGASTTSGAHRVAMIQRAIAGIPALSLIKNELERPAPSYTFDTLRELMAGAKKGEEYYLIIGEDALPNLHRWHKINEIIAMAPLLIGGRSTDKFPEYKDDKLQKAVAAGRVQTRILDISATEIRDRLSKGLYCGHLVHQEVLDYIKEYRLY